MELQKGCLKFMIDFAERSDKAERDCGQKKRTEERRQLGRYADQIDYFDTETVSLITTF